MALSAAAELLSREISSSLGTMFAAWDALPRPRTKKANMPKACCARDVPADAHGPQSVDCPGRKRPAWVECAPGDLCPLFRELCQRVAPMAEEIGIPFPGIVLRSPCSCFDREWDGAG